MAASSRVSTPPSRGAGGSSQGVVSPNKIIQESKKRLNSSDRRSKKHLTEPKTPCLKATGRPDRPSDKLNPKTIDPVML